MESPPYIICSVFQVVEFIDTVFLLVKHPDKTPRALHQFHHAITLCGMIYLGAYESPGQTLWKKWGLIWVRNMTEFLQKDGACKLVKMALEFGTPMLMRAYGNWSDSSLNKHQRKLLESGFHMIHTVHPRPGKNAADIAMVIDVLDVKHRMDFIQCFLLVTGDSDFCQLFRYLRESGRQVIGVGPKSVLSRFVRNLADKFIYTDADHQSYHLSVQRMSGHLKHKTLSNRNVFKIKTSESKEKNRKAKVPQSSQPRKTHPAPGARHKLRTNPGAERPALLKAKGLLKQALLRLPNGPVHMSAVNAAMLRLDGGFSQRSCGFRRFRSFLRASGLVRFAECGKGRCRAAWGRGPR